MSCYYNTKTAQNTLNHSKALSKIFKDTPQAKGRMRLPQISEILLMGRMKKRLNAGKLGRSDVMCALGLNFHH